MGFSEIFFILLQYESTYLGKTRPHMDLWSRRKSITDRSWRSMPFPLPSSRWNWWGVREKVRLWTGT